MSHEIIVPVGTSTLTSWMRNLAPKDPVSRDWLDGRSPTGAPSLAAWLPRFKQSLREGADPTNAEIDSLRRWLAKTPDATLTRITLLVSDTPPGQWVAEALQSIFPDLFDHPVTVTSARVGRLNAGNMRSGLLEFIRAAALAIRECQSRGYRPVVNATPGFKAESALLALLGGLLGAETIYLHEHMKDVIVLPALPLQWALNAEQIRLLQHIGEAATRDAVRDLSIDRHPELLSFVERLGVGHDELWGLSALGQIAVESTEVPSEEPLAARASERAEYVFVQKEQGHTPPGAQRLAEVISQALPFVTKVRLYKFDGAGSSGLLSPREDDADHGLVRLRLQEAGDTLRLRFLLHTTAKTAAQWQAARRLAGEAFGRVPVTEELAEVEAPAPAHDAQPDLAELALERQLLAALNRKEVELRQRDERLGEQERALHAAGEQLAALERNLSKKAKELRELRKAHEHERNTHAETRALLATANEALASLGAHGEPGRAPTTT